MATSLLNTKSNFHGRSNSLPSRPHPLFLKCNEHLESLLRTSSNETSSSSSSLLSHKINGLEDLIECVEKLIQLQHTQDTLLHDCEENWVKGLLDGSLRLLDVCTSAKDALLHTKECTRELQSIIRRKKGSEVELTVEVKKFLTSRKVVRKAISKTLIDLKDVTKNCNILSTNKDHQTVALINLLKDVEVAALSTFQTILQFISGTTQSKSNNWLSISKLIKPKRVGCSLLTDESEFAQLDVALQSFVLTKTGKFKGINDLQNQLEKVESCTQDLEEGLDFLFRRLIKIRVSLLNILSH